MFTLGALWPTFMFLWWLRILYTSTFLPFVNCCCFKGQFQMCVHVHTSLVFWIFTLHGCDTHLFHCSLHFNGKAYYILDELLIAGELQEPSKKTVARLISAQVYFFPSLNTFVWQLPIFLTAFSLLLTRINWWRPQKSSAVQ